MTLRDSLFWRTFALIVLVVVLVGSSLLYFLHLRYHTVAQREAEAHAVFLASQCVKPVLWDDRLQLKALLSSSVDQRVASYAWLERNGVPLAHTFSQGVPKGLLDLHPQGSGKSSVRTWKDQDGQIFLDIAARLHYPADGILHVGVTEDDVDEGFANMFPATAFISMLSLVLGAALARVMANAVTREMQTANQALALSELKYRTLADNTTDWEFWIGPEGQQIYNSPSCERIIGYTPEELDADPDLFAGIVHPDDKPLFAVHRHAACTQNRQEELELRVVHRNGEVRWISHRCRCISGINGECLGTRGANADITARKQVEEALLQERQLFTGGPVGVFTWRPEPGWPVEYVSDNVSDLLGYPVDEVLADGFRFAKLIHPDDVERVGREVNNYLYRGVERFEQSYRLIGKDGKYRWFYDFTRPEYDANDLVVRIHGYIFDQTHIKEAEVALQSSRDEIDRLLQRNQLLLDAAGEGIFGVDHAGRIIFINPVALTMLGLTEAEAMGQNSHALFHHHRPDGRAYPEAECPLHLTLQDGSRRELEQSFIHKSGDFFPVHMVATPMMDDAQLVGAEVLFQDITARKAMEAELTRLATVDSLTGVSNRRHFMLQLEKEFSRIQRFHEPAALLMLDLDHFKRINDSHGHAAGDAVLAALGSTLRGTLRKIDLAGRVGGEEFAMLLPGTVVEAARQFAERLRERVAAMAVETGGERLVVTVSIGIACLDHVDNISADAALARADDALYHAKANGRNRVEVAA